MLGSMECMKKTLHIFSEEGAEFQSGFATTPICCPSRTSMLSGIYVHNHHVHSNKDNCTGIYWREHLEPQSFAVYLSNSGYRTGYFGKYLNEYDGSYVPPGWNEWMALIKNSRFYNYTINYNGRRVKHGDRYHEDYFTDLIANDSINFFKRSMLLFPHKPVLMVLSFPAPHGPEDPAPQYSTFFFNTGITPRTRTSNGCLGKPARWSRCTLLSPTSCIVGNSFAALLKANNTYFMYTSDHGYHLGQFGLIKGKTLPYDFDVKVPFFARGPAFFATYSLILLAILKPVANIDIAPTILDMAGLPVPAHMDGRSFLSLLIHESRLKLGKRSRMVIPWRHSVLIERGIRPKLLKLRERLARQQERFSKDARIQKECGKVEFQPPCKGSQLWECRKNEVDRWRIFKCRGNVGFLEECSCENNITSENTSFEEVSSHTHPKHPSISFHCSPLDREISESMLMEWLASKEKSRAENKKGRRKPETSKRPREMLCSVPNLNCFTHDNSHWRTEPFWTLGPFCFCQNSYNNSYWCLRTVNETHNFLYCEFVTGFVSYYDINKDPFQVSDVPILEQLSAQLDKLRRCKGGAQCEAYSIGIDVARNLGKPFRIVFSEVG
ncbi:extracellular sulfatase Sulf 1 [Trichuris trichiura]|uniref:Extracellular sulfatase Sulf 1 n=1 Tax=Trichuris trichiura TaxID=36087 RepID=A0A077YYJ4_TRITR|nr:extracellular sulfatase Sulf 1 [Trichuris trichiura]